MKKEKIVRVQGEQGLRVKRLSLSRETLKVMDDVYLEGVVGGSYTSATWSGSRYACCVD